MVNQNPYNQGPMMPPLQPVLPSSLRKMVIIPKWLTQNGLIAYLLAIAAVSIMYLSHSLPWYYMLSGVVAVIVFFLYGSTIVDKYSILKIRRVKTFEKRVFMLAFVFRLAWMFLIYTIFMISYGNAFGYENADAAAYDDLGQFVAGLLDRGDFHFYDNIAAFSNNDDIADMGYGVYVGLIYWLTGIRGVGDTSALSIIAVRILKCLWSSLTVLLIYRLAKRNFGEQTGRVAAIFVALWPNFWYYCGAHLKEVEMVFLAVLFVEQADQMLRSRQFTAWKVVPILLIAAALFTVRTPLALVALLSLLFSITMTSERVVNSGKRIIVGGLAILLIGVTMGNSIIEESRGLIDTVQSGAQQQNMEWRTRRTHGNSFAKYAGKSVFAPLIFTIPFPSMVRPFDGQDVQQLLNGGNFVKNIISGLTIFAMFMLLMTGQWRDHLLPLSFMLGYLVVLAFSEFAQSERFHQPAMPFEFMFAAYGLSIAVTKPKYKQWFTYWCAVMFAACIVWSWFKMAGRGL